MLNGNIYFYTRFYWRVFLHGNMIAYTACKVFIKKPGKPVMPELAQPLQ
jgi:hypothetical protein